MGISREWASADGREREEGSALQDDTKRQRW